MNFSFAGCGFLGIYHVGVASCLRAHAPHLLENSKIGGASAGAMAATCLLTGCPLGDCTSYVLKIATKARSRSLGPLHPSFNVVKIIRDGMQEILPKDAYKMASGRLFISMTRVSDRQSVVVSEYESNDDLIQVLLCSAFVPFYAGLIPPSYKGVRYVDGGLSDNMPSLGEDTVFVSPFSGESDICPDDESANFHHIYIANTSVQCTIQNLYRFSRALFPPHPEILSAMCKQGFDDTLKYLQTNDLLSCVRHISVQSTLVPYKADAPNDEATSDYDSSDESDDIHDHSKLGLAAPCTDCRRIQQLALIDTLPPVVVDVLQATCDSMKSGFWSWIYYSKFFHAISLASTPLILPLDILIVYSERFINWIPYLPTDVRWTADSFLYVIKEAIAFINHNRRKYSARLTCELAISDLDLSHAFHAPGESHSNHFKVSTHDVQSFTSCSTIHRIDLNKLRVNTGEDDQGRVHVRSAGPSPLTYLSHIRQHIIEEEDFEKIEVHTTSANNVDVLAEIRNPRLKPSHDSWTNEVVDTFEHTLEAANHMDSVLSYYYREDGDNVKFTEIFSVRPDGNFLEDDDDTEICHIDKV